MPKDCPQGAEEAELTLFRGCEEAPPSDEDLTPHAVSTNPRKKKRAGKGCKGFALSVWLSKEDAHHAQKLFPTLGAKWTIYSADVTKDDGQIAHTPSTDQPGHHSYWLYQGVDLKPRLQFAMAPLEI